MTQAISCHPVYRCDSCGTIFSRGKKLEKPANEKSVSDTLPRKDTRNFDRYTEAGETGVFSFGNRIFHYCGNLFRDTKGIGLLVGTRRATSLQETETVE